MKNYEGKTFEFQGHQIKIMSIDADGGAMGKIGENFQPLSSDVFNAIVTTGVEVAESCDMSEGCDSCGS